MTTIHPSHRRALSLAAKNSKTHYKTTRGLVAFVRSLNLVERYGKQPPQLGRFLKRQTMSQMELSDQAAKATAWKLAEAKRISDPDAKRAKHDPKFRRGFMAGLLRREKIALRQRLDTLDGIMLAADRCRLDSVRLELIECARLRAIVTGRIDAVKAPPKITAGVMVATDATEARKAGMAVDMRGADATFQTTRQESYGNHSPGETKWKGGKPISYTRATHNNYVRSVGLLLDSQRFDFCFHTTRKVCTLPPGFCWQTDTNGLKIVAVASPADDYHPTAGELVAKQFPANCLAKLEANRSQRLLLSAQAAAESAELAGVAVCYRDAIRAGNCEAGTTSFARRHNLDVSQHYSPAELLVQANGDAGRVRLAITAALLRHRKELARGYSILAEHK